MRGPRRRRRRELKKRARTTGCGCFSPRLPPREPGRQRGRKLQTETGASGASRSLAPGLGEEERHADAEAPLPRHLPSALCLPPPPPTSRPPVSPEQLPRLAPAPSFPAPFPALCPSPCGACTAGGLRELSFRLRRESLRREAAESAGQALILDSPQTPRRFSSRRGQALAAAAREPPD